MSLLSHLRKDLTLLARDRQALLVGLALPGLILVVFDQLDLGRWVQTTGRDPEALILVLAVVFPALLLASTALLAERRQGTLARLSQSQVDPLGPVASKGLAALVLIGLQVGILVVVGRFTLSPEASQAPGGLGLLLFTAGAAAYGLGLGISAVARSDSQALQLTALVFLLMLTLSGFLRPLDGIGVVGDVAAWAPMALAYSGVKLLFLGQPEPVYVLSLAIFSVVAVGVAHLLVRWRS